MALDSPDHDAVTIMLFVPKFVAGLVAVLSLFVVACGDDDSETRSSETTEDTLAPALPDDGDGEPSEGRIVEPKAGMADLLDVQIVDSTSADGEVTVWFWSGGVEPCFVVDSVDVEESDTDVTITVRAGTDPAEPDAVCIEISEYLGVKIPVALDGREIIDGSSGVAVPTRS